MAGKTGEHDIARRYATAFFKLAQEQDGLDVAAQDMQTVAALVETCGDFSTFLADPTLTRAAQAKVLVAVAAHLKLSSLTTKLLGTLAEKRRLTALPNIVAAIQARIDAENGIATAYVAAAQALDQTQLGAIAARLKKSLGQDVRIKLEVAPEIIGGLIIQVGSQRIDGSLRTRLDRLHRRLKAANELSSQKKMREVA